MKAVSFSLLYFLVNLGSVPGTYIYESINWVPQNPIFKAEGKPCNNTGPRYLKVELQSTAIFICPNTAIVLQKSSVGIQPANMYENLWLLYNKTAFDNCDVSLDPKRKRLLGCNTPGLLNYISVQFALHTADPDGLRFKGGQSYYFIATSDGTESNLNSTRGGHCADTVNNIHMKVEVYVCHTNQTYTDPRCRSNVGKVQCSAEEITPTTATAPSTQPHTTAQTVPSQTTERRSSTKYTASVTEIVTEAVARPTTTAATTTTTTDDNSTAKFEARCGNDVDLSKDVQMWRLLAIIALICCFLLVVALLLYWQNCFGLNKGSNCPAKGRISNSYPETLPHKPLESQESIIGVSNHGFVVDRHSVYHGDDKRVSNGVSSFGPSHNRCSIYENVDGSQPTLTSTEGDTEDVLEKNASIIIQNDDVYYHNDGEKEKGNGNSPV